MSTLKQPPAVALNRPPSADGLGLGATVAVVAHALLVAALAYGVAWRTVTVQPISAELWASVPQAAAPLPTEAPPPPAPTPTPPPGPVPPKPVTAPPALKADAPSRDADIALEKARKNAQAEREQLGAEAQRKLDEKKAKDKKAADQKLADQKAAKEAADRQAKAELEAKQKLAEQRLAEKKLADKKLADKKADAAAEQKQADDTKKARADYLQRLMKREAGEAAANDGAATANSGNASGRTGSGGTGTAAQSAGPSTEYAGRIRAYLRPRIVFTGRIDGSAVAEVEVRLGPDGTVLSSRLIKSSGQADWDQAVLRTLERTPTLPRDTDGRTPPVMVLSFDSAQRAGL